MPTLREDDHGYGIPERVFVDDSNSGKATGVEAQMPRVKTNLATEAAKRMMKDRGYVVAGFKYVHHQPGDRLTDFGGLLLKDFVLYVTAQTDRADWDEQFKLLFQAEKNPATDDGLFYRCQLLKASW